MIWKPQVHRLWLRPPASANDSVLFNARILGCAELGESSSLGAQSFKVSRPGIARGEVWSGTRISILSASIELAVIWQGKELLSDVAVSEAYD
jgi:hypothetical protein